MTVSWPTQIVNRLHPLCRYIHDISARELYDTSHGRQLRHWLDKFWVGHARIAENHFVSVAFDCKRNWQLFWLVPRSVERDQFSSSNACC